MDQDRTGTAESIEVELPADMQPAPAESEEREAVAGPVDHYRDAEAARQRYEAEVARVQAEQVPPPKEINYDEMESISQVAKTILNQAEAASLRRHVALSEKHFRSENEDYDDVLEKSGVAAAIKIDPATGRPRDPFLWQHIFRSPDPAQTAYDYATGKLSGATPSGTTRPRGTATPRSSSARQTGLTRTHIDRMTDEQKLRLKQDRPDVWRWYLGGG